MEWQPIETVPRQHVNYVLGYFPAHGPWRWQIKEINGCDFPYRAWGRDKPTHWMSRPKPPETE